MKYKHVIGEYMSKKIMLDADCYEKIVFKFDFIYYNLFKSRYDILKSKVYIFDPVNNTFNLNDIINEIKNLEGKQLTEKKAQEIIYNYFRDRFKSKMIHIECETCKEFNAAYINTCGE